MTDVFVPGLVAVIVFYVAILAIGIWAAWKKRKQPGEDDHWNEFSMVGRRDIGVFVGTFTMTASLVGGVYINGIAEFTYTPGFGLIWLQGWFGFVFVLVIGGIFYAKKMREKGYATMLDPLQRKLGNKMGALLYIPAFMGDLFWTASVLIALGGTLSVVIGLDLVIAIIISAFIAVLYTLLGGLYSVAYTDVVQISFIFVGLWIATGFAFANPAVTDIRTTGPGGWYGSFTEDTIGSWIDTLLLFLCGSIPWQVYFQRVLSAESPRKAQIVSCFSAVVAFILGIPPMLIGAIAASTDWNTTAYEGDPLVNGQGSIIIE
ncbi:unnamed protein product [Clavelina lepadiformis]|uniref:Sodium:solute symporter family protein n=1 Tax=Clavelina lepadiformis TaxID=159417 RepID=A0ABP0GWR8_CLALP